MLTYWVPFALLYLVGWGLVVAGLAGLGGWPAATIGVGLGLWVPVLSPALFVFIPGDDDRGGEPPAEPPEPAPPGNQVHIPLQVVGHLPGGQPIFAPIGSQPQQAQPGHNGGAPHPRFRGPEATAPRYRRSIPTPPGSPPISENHMDDTSGLPKGVAGPTAGSNHRGRAGGDSQLYTAKSADCTIARRHHRP